MIKKMLMLASMALALVAFAAPASALADWTHGEAPLEGEAHVAFSGPAGFFVPAAEGGTEAELTATSVLKEGSTGTITSIVAADCTGTGALSPFTCTSTFQATTGPNTYAEVSAENPLTMHCEPDGTINITHVRVVNHYWFKGEGHPGGGLFTRTLTGDIKVTPTNPSAIGTVSLSSENSTVEGAPATVSGDLNASPSGTYGCA